ncbi:hypothetical protein REPUB_Repub05bG0013900 [Reevesia pubescens]
MEIAVIALILCVLLGAFILIPLHGNRTHMNKGQSNTNNSKRNTHVLMPSWHIPVMIQLKGFMDWIPPYRLCSSVRKRKGDRVLCHFCFKPKKVTNEALGVDNARKSQILISSITLLKTALDALLLLSKVVKEAK